MTLTVKSPLMFAPENRVALDGSAALLLVLEGRHGWPFEVRIPFGEKPEDAISCAAYAARIKRGDHVTVEAEGVQPRSDHGLAVNVLRGIARVDVRSATECFVVPGLLR